MPVYPITDALKRGLSPTYNPRNVPGLVTAVGAVPYEGVLKAVDTFTCIDTSSLGTLAFPYPQLFVCEDAIIVCTSVAIYELVSTSLTSKLSGLTAGTTWDCIDFHSFIYLTNGKQAVTKDPTTKAYTVSSTLPFGTCCCNFNGQVFIGSPNVAATGAI